MPSAGTAITPGLTFVHQQNDDPRLGRWHYALATPPAPLADFVESFWGVESFGTYSRETILPRAATEVLFNLGPAAKVLAHSGIEAYEDAWISGLHDRPFDIESDSFASLVSIRLRAEGVLPFLGFPPAEIAGRVVLLRDFFGPEIGLLRERLWEAPDLERRLSILANFAARRFASASPVSAVIQGSLAELRSRPEARVGEMVRESGWSHRHYSARFRAEVGLPPKLFSRIVRFERAVVRIQSARRLHWATLALDSGYADQSHMVHEFRELSGTTPTGVARRLAPDRTGLIPPDLV